MIPVKYISLTFDDGPTIGITDQVLDILEEEHIPASFFLISGQITADTEYLLKRALREIIPALKAQGYSFVTIRDLFEKCGVIPQTGRTYSGAFDIRPDDF